MINNKDKDKDNFAIIMAGGVGTRFWPLSTSSHPKQFHDILGVGRTFIQQTFDRLSKIIPTENIYVITTKEYVAISASQLPEIALENIIPEPASMNTAACNILAAKIIQNINPNAKLVVAPSDHIILDEDVFVRKIALALDFAAKEDVLITLGIEPTRPETGYGYIQYIDEGNTKLKKVKTFTEKPDRELAESFIKSGDFLWNAGIFIWSVKSILKAFQTHLPAMYNAFKLVYANTDYSIEDNLKSIYPTIQVISVDNGILEKAENVYVIPSSFGWSDLGTWNSYYEHANKDELGNVISGKHIYTFNTDNTIVLSTNKKAIIVDGLSNYIVVETKDAILISPRENDQDIKHYVSLLKLNKGGNKFT